MAQITMHLPPGVHAELRKRLQGSSIPMSTAVAAYVTVEIVERDYTRRLLREQEGKQRRKRR